MAINREGYQTAPNAEMRAFKSNLACDATDVVYGGCSIATDGVKLI